MVATDARSLRGSIDCDTLGPNQFAIHSGSDSESEYNWGTDAFSTATDLQNVRGTNDDLLDGSCNMLRDQAIDVDNIDSNNLEIFPCAQILIAGMGPTIVWVKMVREERVGLIMKWSTNRLRRQKGSQCSTAT